MQPPQITDHIFPIFSDFSKMILYNIAQVHLIFLMANRVSQSVFLLHKNSNKNFNILLQKPLSAPSFGRYWKQPIGRPYFKKLYKQHTSILIIEITNLWNVVKVIQIMNTSNGQLFHLQIMYISFLLLYLKTIFIYFR